MADTNNPRGHCNAVAGQGAAVGSGRRGNNNRRGRGPKPRASGRGNSAISGGSGREVVDANSERGDGSGRGSRGRRGRGSSRGRVTEVGGDKKYTSRTPSRVVISNTFHSFDQRTASKLSSVQMEEFLRAGLSDIASSTESREEFVKNLATETGLARVRQIVETDFSLSHSVLKPMFDPHCIMFLRLVSHEGFRYSLVLERAVGTIYNVIYGHDGKRGVNFFDKIADCLIQMTSEADGEKEIIAKDEVLKIERAFLLTTKALLSTLTLNQEAAIKTEFGVVVKKLSVCYQVEDINRDLASLDVRSAYENILKIKDILSIGDAIPVSTAANIRATTTSRQKQPEFLPPKLDVDLPGHLSLNGPRHDNDHALISDIKILPTLSEILHEGRPDFLPTRHNSNGPSKHHEIGILRLLDTQFRLLREDTSGLLRDSTRMILENWKTLVHTTDWRIKSKVLRAHSPTPVRIYFEVEIQRIKYDRKRGVEIEIEFDQVRGARNSDFNRRKLWWRKSRSLREGGTILALVDGEEENNKTVIFLLVSKREIGESQDKQQSLSGIPHVYNLAGDPKRAMITLRLASPTSEDDLSYLANKNRRHSSSRPLILVEFPAVLYNYFEGVLRCLQSLHKDPASMPFTTWLSPRVRDNTLAQDPGTVYTDGRTIVPPPQYLLNNVTLDLSCIPTLTNNDSNSNSTNTPLTISLSDDPHKLSRQLSELTTLDSGQAAAMVSALRHEIALIQGPPGTGKSYVGIQIARCLLANRDLLELGPILCVCYTNHALDQFLHELLNSGVTKIVRIGSRSPSPRLENLSLDNYNKTRQIPRIKGLGKRISDCQANLDNLGAEIQILCRHAEESDVEVVKRYLKNHQIFGDKSEGGKMNFDSESGHDSAVENWKSGDAPGDWSDSDLERSIDQLLGVDIWTLKNSERALLYQYWHDTAFAELSQQLHSLMRKHSLAKQLLTSLVSTSQTQFLNQFHIVGVTTTGLANNSDLLRSLCAKVLICEEAGEVLEAHVLTVLLRSIQHAILIGDHLQLRPRISNLKLSMEYDRAGPKYNLDESLFERLANLRFGNWDADGEGGESGGGGQFPIAKLDHQRRMHPTISTLVRETLYPHLQDHLDTKLYPEIAGMGRRLFWLDHDNTEDAGDPEEPMQSKTNLWEANMVTALVRHLCKQGKYKRGEIAVLTPYLGQLRILKDMLEKEVMVIIGDKDLEDLDASDVEVDERDKDGKGNRAPQQQKGNLLDQLRMASVDNFQGEEATVVIASLVRSNKYRNCGFLKTPNRINVLLSRARHGMYIIGDAKTSSQVPMWSSVIQLLETNRNIGPKLELQCPRHPKNRIYVSSPEDFAIHAPEGGCAEKCSLRLSCGHSCMVKCHSKTRHEAVKCMKPCTKIRECKHPCSKKCHEVCGRCPERFLNVVLPCGHEAKEVECHRMGNLADVKCKEPVEREMAGCGHITKIQCHESTNDIMCSNPCDSSLPCGHRCQKQCWRCAQNNDHGFCNTLCGRQFTTCSHTCDQPCHPNTPCSPCSRPCEVRCKHNKCPKTCSDPCPPCAEECGWNCGHRDRCNMPCAIPCDIIPCDRRCEKNLACGHRCPGVCGELCPDSKFCQLCCEPEIRKRIVDWIEFETYGQIDIDKNPLIFLSCGHFHVISSLDGIMELAEYYVTDSQTGKIVRPKLSQRVAMSGNAPKGCPECRMPLRNIDRYNRIVKKALLDEATRRFVAQANLKCAELMEEIHKREMNIEDERRNFMREWSEAVGESRDMDQITDSLKAYQAEGFRLQKRINNFTKSVAKTEQPFGKVNRLFASAVARQQNITTNAFEFDESAIQTGFQIRGECFSLRLGWAIFWDFDTIYSNSAIHSRVRSALSDVVASRIKGLIKKCLSLIESSRKAKFPQQEAEALIYDALFAILSLSNSRAQGQSVDAATENSTRVQAKESLEKCESLISQYPGSLAYLKDDAEKAKRLVNGGTFYSFVTTEEKQEVYKAMAEQFSGTGHWYYCRNNHPFTVGECGMPMEEARCPQCEEPIGGHDHTPAQGVLRAEDLEAEFGGH